MDRIARLGELPVVLPFPSVTDHPHCFAYVPGSGTWPGVLGELITSACDAELHCPAGSHAGSAAGVPPVTGMR
jgi:hypothetical protein